MLILLTNDDGIHSPGISAMKEALTSVGEVFVVAPDRERSAVGHALTLHSPLRADELTAQCFSVDGTPTDCIFLGVNGLLPRRPDLIVSGVNRGANLGDDVTYSGTVAAAMEGALMGVPAIALSLDGASFTEDGLRHSRTVAVALAELVLRETLPADTFLNVNIPAAAPKGCVITRQGRRRYGDSIIKNTDPRGRAYYWIGNDGPDFELVPGTDAWALARGYVSVTPLHLDLTNHQSLTALAAWSDGRYFKEIG